MNMYSYLLPKDWKLTRGDPAFIKLKFDTYCPMSKLLLILLYLVFLKRNHLIGKSNTVKTLGSTVEIGCFFEFNVTSDVEDISSW